MNLSKYEHAERKEAEASKDAPETPQDSGAEQKTTRCSASNL